MTYRRRLTLTVAVAVGLAIATAAVVAFIAVRSELRGQVDDRLREQAPAVAELPPSGPGGRIDVPPLPGPDEGQPVFVRRISANGDVTADRREGNNPDPPTPSAAEVRAISSGSSELQDVDSGGEHLRVISTAAPDGGIVQVARSLESVDDVLANLRTVLFLVTVTGIAGAALTGRFLANRMLAPVSRLSAAAEHVSQTEDLSSRIDVVGEDEIAQLGSRFNTMLGRLERSRTALDSANAEQRRLIADASHELRTPVTALRTNIELLSQSPAMPQSERAQVLDAAVAQADELGGLIGDLMALARGEAPQEESETIRLDELVAEALDRARTHAPEVAFDLDAEPCLVEAAPERIARALNNLLDNAAAHSAGKPVEVSVKEGVVRIHDHGPGLPPAELERVFDRFYRGREGRSRPGSGLGLAIVKQVAEAHGGSVSAMNAPEGGAVFELALPLCQAV